jgi:hypothetical protein
LQSGFLNYSKSLEFLNECIEKEYVIIGIERFVSSNEKIIPDLKGIADYSQFTKHDSIKSINSAKQYLLQYGTSKEELFEFVLL